jgi:hypothetical protein
MKTKKLLFCVLLSAFCFSAFGQRVRAYKGSRIFWDISSKTTVINGGNYARMIQLQDGRLLAVAEAQGGICVAYSNNNGTNWGSAQRIIASATGFSFAVPDVIQLTDGTIVVGYNPRPRSPYSEERKFGIRTMRSTDNGNSWSESAFVFDAQHTFDNGCWEPAFLELPSGELQCYFANENAYTTNGDQNISMCRSFDGGQTWGAPVIVCYRQGARDGMPVPILLQDSSEIVVIIEDNGWAGRGNFAATTVRNTLASNWNNGYVNATSTNRTMIFQTTPPTNIVSAAPYLRRLPWGETVASFQSNENRTSGDLQYFDMQVLVGDDRARNFKAKSAPFSLDEQDRHSIWNSVSVIDTGIVVALGSIGQANRSNDAIMMKGYPIRQATAKFGTITVDGVKDAAENWTSPTTAQLMFGNISKDKGTVDFLYDNQYLYLTARVIDRNIINTGIDNDGVRFLIDANDVSTASPQTGMYSFFFDTNGTVKFQRGDDGAWVTDANNLAIQYALNTQSVYYNIEAAIPWTLLGKTTPPVGSRMAIDVEIVHRAQFTLKTETIADANKDASWTWLEFRLTPDGSLAVNNAKADSDKVKIVKKNGELHVGSPILIKEFSLFSSDGKLISKKNVSSQNFKIPISKNSEIGIAKFLLADGSIISKKIIF